MTVSIVTPTTHDRLHFNQRIRAIAKAQDYPNIVEHVFHYGKGTIGEKRNRCNEIAIGDIIVHMDSDDYYATDWVSKCVKLLQDNPTVDIIGLSQFYATGNFKYVGSNNSKIVWGATMAYRKTFWESNKFKNIQVGEDYFFCKNANVLINPYIDGFLASIHSGNTSPKNTNNPAWISLSRKDFPDSLLGIAEL
jgi:glycosyltransferase involved in cell wall biosynthesis